MQNPGETLDCSRPQFAIVPSQSRDEPVLGQWAICAPGIAMMNSAKPNVSAKVSFAAARAMGNSSRAGLDLALVTGLISISLVTKDST
jgi:hypothetical protein